MFPISPSYPQWKDVLDSICAILGSCNFDLNRGLTWLQRLWTSVSKRVLLTAKIFIFLATCAIDCLTASMYQPLQAPGGQGSPQG